MSRGDVNRVLVVAEDPVFPVESGSSTQIANWFLLLRQNGLVPSLLSIENSANPWTERGRRQALEHVDRLWIYRLPMGAMARTLHRLISLLGLILAGRPRGSSPIRDVVVASLRRRIQSDLRGEQFTVVLVNKPTTLLLLGAGSLRDLAPRLAIDIHDVHAFHRAELDRAIRRLSWKAILTETVWRSFWIQRVEAARSRRGLELRDELALLESFDAIVAWSRDEAKFLRACEGLGARVVSGDYPIVIPDRVERTPTYDLGFIGSAALLNCEAMHHFVNSVWPSIRSARRNASLLVAGGVAHAVCRMVPRSASSGITTLARISDLNDFYGGVKIIIVPLLGGSGVSVKTVEALANGAAVVATPAGARGLALKHGRELLVAEAGAPFAAACVSLLADEDGRLALSAAARRCAETRFRLGLQDDVIRAVMGVTSTSQCGR